MDSKDGTSLVGHTFDGRYHLVELLGEGSTGAVYRARQLNVDRDVAVKVLNTAGFSGAALPEISARFENEARIISRLRHPHTVKLHDFGKTPDGRLYLVMEFLQGQTLDRVIEGGPLDERRTLRILRQVSDSLAEAHQQGIIHRDLKPANILLERVSDQDEVKVLDFGVAKVAAQPLRTATGAVIGTPAYMSPEQAQGEELDPRTDLYSLGVVAYHCLSGRLPFRSDTPVSLLLKHVTEPPPPLSSLSPPTRVSPELESLIMRLLAKKREKRPASAQVVRDAVASLEHRSVEIPRVSERPANVAAEVEPHRRGPSTKTLVTAILGVGLLAAAFLFVFSRQEGDSNRPPQFQGHSLRQFTDQAGLEGEPTLSPDGKFVVFASDAAGNFDVYLQRIDGERSINLTADSKDNEGSPAFSPDGTQIAYVSNKDGAGLYLMGVTGESNRRVAETAFNPCWSADGKEVFYATERMSIPSSRAGGSAIWAIEIATGKRRRLTDGDGMQPNASPHGYRVGYWAINENAQRDIWTIGVNGEDPVPVTVDEPTDFNPVWSPEGDRIYYLSDRTGVMNLWRIPVDERTGKVTGQPEAVTSGGTILSDFAMSRSGLIAYTQVSESFSLKHARFDPVKESIEGTPNTIQESSRTVVLSDLSPDGKQLVFMSHQPAEDIVISSVDGSGRRLLTNDRFRDRRPRFSRDGKTVAFYSTRAGRYNIWAIQVDGTGLRQLTDMKIGTMVPVWSPDGGRLVTFSNEQGSRGLYQFEVPVAPPVKDLRLLPGSLMSEGFLLPSSWSPDGTMIAGTLAEGKTKPWVFVYSFAKEKLELVVEGGGEPAWLNDSRRLLFLSEKAYALVDLENRKVRPILTLPPDLKPGGFAISRDNRELYFMTVRAGADIWLLSPPARN